MYGLVHVLILAANAACSLEAPADAPFEVRAPDGLDQVRLVPLIRLDPATQAHAVETGRVFSERGVVVGFSLRPEDAEAVEDSIAALVAQGHLPVARLREAQVGVDSVKDPGRLRQVVAPITSRAGRPKAVEVALGDKNREAVMHRIGLRAVFETNGASTGTPRKQLRFEGQPAYGVILPAGPYAGACGRTPVVDGLTPPAADRTTQALYGARASGVGFVRITVLPDAETPAVLARWLDEVLLPGGVVISDPVSARDLGIKGLKSGSADQVDPKKTAGGRLIRVDEVIEVARAVAELDEIPRLLPKDLTPSEAFMAFLLVTAGKVEGDVVRLPAIQGPATLNAQLPEPIQVQKEDAVALASALISRLPDRIPSALPVGGQLLNAPALFSLYASLARGEDPGTARPMAVREPNAPGLGWGDATTP